MLSSNQIREVIGNYVRRGRSMEQELVSSWVASVESFINEEIGNQPLGGRPVKEYVQTVNPNVQNPDKSQGTPVFLRLYEDGTQMEISPQVYQREHIFNFLPKEYKSQFLR